MSLRYESYDWAGGREWMLAAGPQGGPQVLIVPPLFEEANYTRAILAEMARALAGRGIGAWIMDLPGTGESAQAVERTGWDDWRGAVAAAAAEVGGHVASLRGGALLEDHVAARSWWRYAATDGAALLRQMERAQSIGDRENGRPPADPQAPTIDLIGYRLNRPLREALRAATPVPPAGPLREMPFAGPGAPPWRRAEPVSDAAFSAMLADDLADWILQCDG